MEKYRFSEPQKQVTLSNKQAYVLINETVEEHPVFDADGNQTSDTVKEYVYDGVKLLNVLSEHDVMPRLKEYVLSEISAYDKSFVVNSFTIDGKEIWLDRDTRLALRQRFVAEQASGIKSTTLWYGTDQFNLSVPDAIEMLNTIEIYACKCYDVTAAHKAMVQSMTTLDDVFGYDYTTGYPEKPSFTTTDPASAAK